MPSHAGQTTQRQPLCTVGYKRFCLYPFNLSASVSRRGTFTATNLSMANLRIVRLVKFRHCSRMTGSGDIPPLKQAGQNQVCPCFMTRLCYLLAPGHTDGAFTVCITMARWMFFYHKQKMYPNVYSSRM
ncbi:unnamed protein product [Soboliphyme baturini]|uniref:Secreted protein n=1 Tax=Soboliphyme baturini TaxID=241478 RepID=A0A183ITK2_9BILA|nr:unnamed protein product [Soboliphyme baturini]